MAHNRRVVKKKTMKKINGCPTESLISKATVKAEWILKHTLVQQD